MKNILIGPRPILGRSAAQLLVRCFALIVLFCSVSIASATSIDLFNNDDPGEGFSSNAAPFAGQTGNNGSTLGEQRLNVFQAAADYWEEKIESTVPIKIGINFDPQECDSGGAILGAAGPNSLFRDFQNAPIANIWYVVAVANSLAGSDLDGMSDDIGATFNSDIDNNNNCLSGTNWWYGINSPAPGGTISLFDTVLHEIGHGLGVLSLVEQNGVYFQGRNDAYAYHLFDEQTQKFWRDMNDGERVTSSTNGPNLTWRGYNADNNSDHLDSALSRTNGNIRMYAPSPYQSGSSVSHWDTSLSPDELMEPSATLTSDDRSTVQLLKDVGWNPEGAGEISFVSANYSVRENQGPATISVQRTGGFDGAVSVSLSTSAVSASSGVDYTSAVVPTNTLNWADGELGIKTYDITIIDDEIEESAETVSLTLSGATNGAVIASPGIATLTISDPITVDQDDDFVLTTMPAVLAALVSSTPPAPPAPPAPPPPVVVNPRWSVENRVCCEVSNANFQVNQGSASRSSTAQTCSDPDVPAPQSSEVESTPGNKAFSWSWETAGCPIFGASFNFEFQEATRYVFVAEIVNGDVGVNIYSGGINRTATADNTVGDSAPKLNYETTIRLANETKGESSFKSNSGDFKAIKK
jgi:hypothetical protein